MTVYLKGKGWCYQILTYFNFLLFTALKNLKKHLCFTEFLYIFYF